MDTQAETLRLQINQLMKKAGFEQVVSLCKLRSSDENADVAVIALLGLNIAAISRGDFALAVQYFEQALQLAREKASLVALCDVLCRRSFLIRIEAISENEQNELTQAQEALKVAERAEFNRGVVEAKIALGNAHARLGAKKAAQTELEEAVELARHVTSDIEMDALNALAQFYNSRNTNLKAIDLGKRALKIAQALGDDLGTSILISNMSYYYFKVARDFRSYDTSIEYSQQGLDLARRLRYFYGEYCGLLALARSYHIARLNQQAAAKFSEVLALTRSCGNKIWEYECLTWLSGLYLTMKDYTQAVKYAEQEIEIADQLNKPRWRIHGLNVLGNIYNRKRRSDLALEYWRKALILQEELGMNHGFWYHFSRFSVVTYPLYVRFRRR